MNLDMNMHISPMIPWAAKFADMWFDLVDGQMDLFHTLDWAYELQPKHGHRSPTEVAKEEYLADIAGYEALAEVNGSYYCQ